MIRLTHVLRRHLGMSLQEFRSYLSNTHGPLIMRYSTLLRIRKYVQVYTIDDPANEELRDSRGAEKAYDGVQEIWWDSRQDILDAMISTEGQEATRVFVKDEKNFIDLKHSPGWFGYEVPQINPTPENIIATEKSPLVKLYYVLHHLPNKSVENAQFYWRVYHGPKVRQYARAHRPLRYIQVHRLEDELNKIFSDVHGTEKPPYYGHAELWFDRVELAAGLTTPEGVKAAQVYMEDEKTFIDLSRSAIWFAKEQVFIDRIEG